MKKIDRMSKFRQLPGGCNAFGKASSVFSLNRWIKTWTDSVDCIHSILVLACTKTAEIEGISAAGATKESRRFTALADAELLLQGPLCSRKWSLPPLPAGVSPALISHVASRFINVKSVVVNLGLPHPATFPCLHVDPSLCGPSNCLTTGKAMNLKRVENLWKDGFTLGMSLKHPLLISECVPAGTTTALAVLTGLGLKVGNLISGSNQIPPVELKQSLVQEGLQSADLGEKPLPRKLLAAVGDPFQPFAVGLLLGARQIRLPVLLGGGSQMLAVLAIALASLDVSLRADFLKDVSIGTTGWLVSEKISSFEKKSEFDLLINKIEDFFEVSLLCLSSNLDFSMSSKKVLRDYELGFIKEGVGAGALSLLAQINGFSCKQLLRGFESAVEQLQDEA